MAPEALSPHELARRYRNGETLADLAYAAGMAEMTIKSRLLLANVQLRNKGRRKRAPDQYLPKSQEAGLGTTEHEARKRAAAEGSERLARRLWAYGAKYNGLPGFPPEVCRELLERAA